MPNPEQLFSQSEFEPTSHEPVALGLSSGDIDSAMDLYLDFTQLPKEEREKIHHIDTDRPRTGESGYRHKGLLAADGSPLEDNKHVFHWSQQLGKEFPSEERKNLPQETRLFLAAAEEVYNSLTRSAKEKYQELEQDFPLLVGIHFPKDGMLQHNLRFLAYQTGNDGVLARGHYDKGTGTIAVAESHGGLRLGIGEDDIQALDRDNYDPTFFRGYGWHQLAQMLDVDTIDKAAWHDVIDTGEQVDEEVTRWALVYFVDPASIYLSSTKQETHTPIAWDQERGLRATQSLHNIDFLKAQNS